MLRLSDDLLDGEHGEVLPRLLNALQRAQDAVRAERRRLLAQHEYAGADVLVEIMRDVRRAAEVVAKAYLPGLAEPEHAELMETVVEGTGRRDPEPAPATEPEPPAERECESCGATFRPKHNPNATECRSCVNRRNQRKFRERQRAERERERAEKARELAMRERRCVDGCGNRVARPGHRCRDCTLALIERDYPASSERVREAWTVREGRGRIFVHGPAEA